MKQSNQSAEAEASLKLGLLYNKEGKERNIKKSQEYLQGHFDLLRGLDNKKNQVLDSARVNLGVVNANMKIENYKYMILTNL